MAELLSIQLASLLTFNVKTWGTDRKGRPLSLEWNYLRGLERLRTSLNLKVSSDPPLSNVAALPTYLIMQFLSCLSVIDSLVTKLENLSCNRKSVISHDLLPLALDQCGNSVFMRNQYHIKVSYQVSNETDACKTCFTNHQNAISYFFFWNHLLSILRFIINVYMAKLKASCHICPKLLLLVALQYVNLARLDYSAAPPFLSNVWKQWTIRGILCMLWHMVWRNQMQV